MAEMPNLPFRSYLGQGAVGGYGRAGATYGGAAGANIQLMEKERKRKRARLLIAARDAGKLDFSQLGPEDSKLVGSELNRIDIQTSGPSARHGLPGVGGIRSGLNFVGDLLGNLGSDVWQATKGLPSGVAQTIAAGAHDLSLIKNPFLVRGTGAEIGPDDSAVVEKVIKPTLKGYKETYAGGGGFKGFLGRVYEHPLQPILDVGTVASLGAGGTAKVGTQLSRAGKISPESRLARMGRTDTRPSVPMGNVKGIEDVQAGEIPRYYSRSPTMKATQILSDVAGEKIAPYGRWQANRAQNRRLTETHSQRAAEESHNVRGNIIDLVATRKGLSQAERDAMYYIDHGINTDELMDWSEELARRSLEGKLPDDFNYEQFAGSVERGFVEHKTVVPERVRELVRNPEQSPRLVDALAATREQVEVGRESLNIPEEFHQMRVQQPVRNLWEMVGRPEPGPEGPEAPPPVEPPPPGPEEGPLPTPGPEGGAPGLLDEGVPDIADEELLPEEITAEAPPPGEPTVDQAETEAGIPNEPDEPPPDDFDFEALQAKDYPFPPTYVPEEAARGFEYQKPWLFQRAMGQEPNWVRGRKEFRNMNLGATTFQNVLSTPHMGYLQGSSGRTFVSGVARKDSRAFVEHVAQRERDLVNKAYNQKWIDQYALRDNEGNLIRETSLQAVRDRFGDDFALVQPEEVIRWFRKEMEVAQKVGDDAAKMGADAADENALKNMMDSIGEDAKDFVKENVLMAAKNPGIVVPRSALEYQIKLMRQSEPYGWKVGQLYARAMHVWRTATLAFMPRWALNTAIGSFILAAVKGITPEDFYLANRYNKEGIFADTRAAGAKLGQVIGLEILEPGMKGITDRAIGTSTGPMGTKIVEKVQAIEDYFRKASWVHSLRHEQKRRVEMVGDTLESQELNQGNMTDMEYIDHLMNDEQLMERVLNDVNRFSYNFAVLGPAERRYVRQFVPFWGWYKFISKLAWTLPVEHPGRSLLMTHLGTMGANAEEELGPLPEWIRGSLIYNFAGGKINYLSTMGMNPFSSLINPVGPQGFAEGLGQLSQASPLLQAGLSAYGHDPMRGGNTPISPESGVAQDFFGAYINTRTGEETDIGKESAGRRFVGSLLRSFPQVRMAEKGAAGGRNVYPESIPLLSQRPMPSEGKPTSPGKVALEMLGVAPKEFDVEKYQSLLAKRVKYARARNSSARKRLRTSLREP